MNLVREKIIKYGTYVLVGITPILYFGDGRFTPYVTSKVFFFYGLVEIVFALWLYTIFVNKSYRLPKKTLLFFVPLTSFIVWMTIAGFAGVNPELSFWSSFGRATGLLTLYHVLALSLVISSLVNNKKIAYIQALILWFLGGALIVALSVWLGDEGFNLPFSVFERSKGGGLIGNSSLTATYLLFALFLGVFLAFSKDTTKSIKKWIYGILAVIIFSPLFIDIYELIAHHNFSISARGAMLGIIAGAGVFIVGALALSQKKSLRVVGIIGAIICVFALLFTWNKFITPDTRIHQTFVESASGSRFIFWDIAKKAIDKRPIFGFGPENYSVVYQKYFDPHLYVQFENDVEVWNDRAHNIFFDTGVAGGWPAIVLYGTFLFSILYAVYRAFKLTKITRLQAGVLWGLVIGYVIQNLFVFDSLFSFIGLAILCGIVFGLIGGNSETKETSKASEDASVKKNLNFQPKKSQSLVASVIIVILFIPTWIMFTWMPARKSVRIVDVTNMSLNKRPDHYQELLKGPRIGDGRDVGAIAHAAYLLYRKNTEKIENDPRMLPLAQKDLEKLIEYLEAVAKREVNDTRLYLSIGRLYNVYLSITDKKNDKELMQHIIDLEKHAQVLSPNSPEVGWTIAQTLIYNGDLVGAEEALKQSISLAPYIKSSRLLLLAFAKNTNNQKLYNETLLDAQNAIQGFSIEAPSITE